MHADDQDRTWAAPVAAGPVRARIWLPASKSITNRALVLAALSDRLARIDGRWHWTERRVINDLYGDISRHVRYAPHGGAG